MSRRNKSADTDAKDRDDSPERRPESQPEPQLLASEHAHVTPTPIRWRIIVLHYKHWHPQEIREALGVSLSTVYAMISLFEVTGDVAPRRGKRPRELGNSDLASLLQLVVEKPGLYLREYRSLLLKNHQITLSNAGLCRALHDLGFSPKKLCQLAQAADEKARAEFQAKMPTLDTARLVFFDETRIDDRSLSRSHGWGQRGQRLQRTTLYINGIRYSLVAAMSTKGILGYYAIRTFFNGERLAWFVRTILAKSVLPGSIFVLDNSNTHHTDVFLEAIRSIGCAYLFLPAYSPDYNPIEEAWHTLKDGVRAAQERMGTDVCTDPYELIEHGVNACTVGNCLSWISHAGYKV